MEIVKSYENTMKKYEGNKIIKRIYKKNEWVKNTYENILKRDKRHTVVPGDYVIL